MKRKFFAVLLLLFASFLLTGCDLFGGADETTTTTVTTTTSSTTTTTTTTTTAAATTTLPDETYFTVTFYNGDGSVLITQNVLEGTAATTPAANPFKAPDAQYTYTFSHWNQSYTNVTANMQINPVFTNVVNNYTVTFYNEDNSVLLKRTVPYGGAATSPTTSPVKPDDGTDTYTFTGWDKPFNNIIGNLDVYPLFSDSFNETLLAEMVNDLFNPDDVDDEILNLLAVTGVASEEELYTMLTNGMVLFEELQTVESAAEMQTWYAHTKTLGFNKNVLVTMLYNAMSQGMTNDLSNTLEDMTYYTAELSAKTQMLLDYNTQLLAFDAEVADYCLTGVDTLLSVECQGYWGKLKEKLEAETNFFNELNLVSYENSDFNLSVWNDLQDLQYNFLEASEFSADPDEITTAQNNLNAYIENLSTAEEMMYNSLLTFYVDYVEKEMALGYPNYSNLDVLDLSGTQNVREHLEELFYGNSQDYVEGDTYYNGYAGYIHMIPNVEWSIQYISDELERTVELYDELLVTVGFVTDPLYEQNMKDLIETLYDGLDAVILEMDQEMFDMVMDLVLGQFIDPDSNARSIGQEISLLDIYTPEKIAMIASKLNIVLTAFYNTLDQTDYDNIKVLLLGYLDDTFEADGMTPSERTAYLAVIGTTYDKYVIHFQFIVGELQSFLGSLDEPKITAVMELIPNEMDMEIMTDIDIAILASQAIDILFGDDSFDVSGILQIMAEGYFDVTTELNPIPADVAIVQAAIDVFMIDTFALVDIVKDLNPTYVSEANVEQILELIGRAEAITTWFTDGFESVLDTPIYYNDDMFDDFVWQFLDADDPSVMLTMFMDAFGTADTEATYYRVRSLFQYAIGILNIRSFEGIQEWVGGIDTFGHTQAEWVDYLVNILKYVTEENRDGDQGYDQQMTYLLSQITDYENMIDEALAQMTDIDANAANEISLLDPSLQADATLFWEASKQNMLNYEAYSGTDWNLQYELDYMYITELQGIIVELYESMNPYDAGQNAIVMANYDAFFIAHADYDYLGDLIEQYKDDYYAYYAYDLETYQPILTIIQAEPAYSSLESYITNEVSSYAYNASDTIYYQEEINLINESITDLEESLWFINVIYDLVNDPTNEPLTEEAINIVMDDFQNMIALMPVDSFELIERIFEMMTTTDNYLQIDTESDHFDDSEKFEIPFTAEEIYALTQDLSAFLKLRLQTIDPTEMIALENYVLIVITEYVSDQGLVPLDEAAEITRLNTLVLKYLGLADETLDELTALLDGLSVEGIQALMDYIMIMSEGGMNIYEQVIRGAQVFDELLDPTMVDLTVITGILNELYFDMEIETYLPSDLSDVQTAWAAHVLDVEALIASVAVMNPEMMDPADFPTLFELQQKVMYMGYLFMDPEDILTIPTFAFDYEMLANIVGEMFNENDSTAVDAIILDLLDVFNLGPTDFEDLFYIILGVGSVIQGMPEIESPTDVLRALDGILSLGYTNVEIASFVMNGVMTFLVPQLPDMYDTSELEAELLDIQGELDNAVINLDAVNTDVLVEIALMIDPFAMTSAQELWEAYNLRHEAYAMFDIVLNNYSEDNEMFQWGLWDEIADAIYNDDGTYVDYLLMDMDWEEKDMYQELINLYNNYLNLEDQLEWNLSDFASNYGYVMTVSNPSYSIFDYLNDNAAGLQGYYMEIIWRELEVERLERKIIEIEDMAWLPQTLEIMFADPANVTLSEEALVILIDQVDAWAENPDTDFIDSLPMILENGLENYSTADLSAELLEAGAFIQVLFGTVDLADEAVLEAWLLEAVDAFAETQETDPTELAALQTYLGTMVTDNFSDFLDIPSHIGTFLLTMDEAKTQALIDQLVILSKIDDSTPEGELAMVVTIAGILDLLVGDGSLDYDSIYHPIFGIVYGVNDIMGNYLDGDLLILRAFIDNKLDNIVAQAAIVALIDPATTDVAELAAIQLLMEMVENLGVYADMLFDGEPAALLLP